MRGGYFIPALACILLVSCQTGPVTVPFKAGITYSDMERDIDMCRISSFKEIPQSIATQISPGYSNPGFVHCTGSGAFITCNNYGGVNIPPSSYNYDVNQGLRDRYVGRCLQSKGYIMIQKPICTAEQTKKPELDRPKSPDEITCVVM
jgi:hypothetical protein